MKTDKTTTLSINIRILIGIASLPSLFLGLMLVNALLNEQANTIGAFEVVYALVGFVGVYIAITGKRLF
jgi:uncharacterized membrane protein YuzA (DUF378 family)